MLKPWAERGARLDAANIIAAARPKLLAIPEAIVLSFDPPSIPASPPQAASNSRVEDLTGQGAQALNNATQALLAEPVNSPNSIPISFSPRSAPRLPEYNYDLDRSKVKLLGLNLSDVFNTLQIYLGSLYINDFKLFGRTFRVTMQAERGARADAEGSVAPLCAQTGGQMVPPGHARQAALRQPGRNTSRITTSMVRP